MKKFFQIKTFIFFLVIGGFFYFFNSAYHPPVLMYHSISPQKTSSKLVVDPVQFERQMQFLKEKHYKVLPLEKWVQNKKHSLKTITLTFDDGYEDNYIYAYPVLKKFQFPATIFIVTEWIEKPGYLKWNQIKEMEKNGIRFGNHTHTHAYLPSLSVKEFQNEILEPKKILKTQLRNPSSVFCYPFGAYSLSIQDFIKNEGYQAALATSSDGFSPLADPYAFRRIRISDSSNNLFVFWIETSGYYSFIRQVQKKIKKIKKKIWLKS